MIRAIPVSMKVLMGIFLISIPTFLHAEDRDSLDNVAYGQQIKAIETTRPDDDYFYSKREYEIWVEKQKTKGSWKYSLEEWMMVLTGRVIEPEYYYDEDLKASNGGWAIA